MKRIVMPLLGILLTGTLTAQDHTEKISKEFTLEKKSPANALIVANINGDVKVTSYEGDKIMVEVTKTIRAKTDARLEKGKSEIQLGVIDRVDTLVLFVEGPCISFGRANRKNRGDRWSRTGHYSYDWNDCNNNRSCREEYDYTMDFVVKVPASLNVAVSTVNDGDILVENVKGAVIANNINGNIKLTNLVREADASTINGDLDVTYTKNPDKDCRFYSLNGDINALFQKGLAANLSFESFNGEFYTDIQPIEGLPVKVEQTKEGDGIKYKVNGNRYKIRTGGALLDFETFNGDVFLKEKVN
ncbi:MAG TPA: hypothetical protein VFU05_03800 [Cyclobacteriaceae bacterium]|nr:hypothetical protein [Cyclobacteriaceae bacterium]